jgi:hypothetical protein
MTSHIPIRLENLPYRFRKGDVVQVADGDKARFFALIVQTPEDRSFWDVLFMRPCLTRLIFIEKSELQMFNPKETVVLTIQPGFRGVLGLVAVNLIRELYQPTWLQMGPDGRIKPDTHALLLESGLLDDQEMIRRIFNEGPSKLEDIWRILLDTYPDPKFLASNLAMNLGRGVPYTKLVAGSMKDPQVQTSCAVELCRILANNTDQTGREKREPASAAIEVLIESLDPEGIQHLKEVLIENGYTEKEPMRFNGIFKALAQLDPEHLKDILHGCLEYRKPCRYLEILSILGEILPPDEFKLYLQSVFKRQTPWALRKAVMDRGGTLIGGEFWWFLMKEEDISDFRLTVATFKLFDTEGERHLSSLNQGPLERIVHFMDNDQEWHMMKQHLSDEASPIEQLIRFKLDRYRQQTPE